MEELYKEENYKTLIEELHDIPTWAMDKLEVVIAWVPPKEEEE